MKVYVTGASKGEYQGNTYGRIYALESIENNGFGHKAVAYKCSAALVDKMIQQGAKKNCKYDLDFNQFGKVVDAVLSEEKN